MVEVRGEILEVTNMVEVLRHFGKWYSNFVHQSHEDECS